MIGRDTSGSSSGTKTVFMCISPWFGAARMQIIPPPEHNARDKGGQHPARVQATDIVTESALCSVRARESDSMNFARLIAGFVAGALAVLLVHQTVIHFAFGGQAW